MKKYLQKFKVSTFTMAKLFSNIKKVKDLASLTVWDRRKRRDTAKTGKIINNIRPDRLSLKHDFQNCL